MAETGKDQTLDGEGSGSDFSLYPDGDDIWALLVQIERETGGEFTSAPLQAQIEFGIGPDHELIDEGGSGDVLGTLSKDEHAASHSADAVDTGPGLVPSDTAGMSMAASLFAVKIVFGDDESSSTPPL